MSIALALNEGMDTPFWFGDKHNHRVAWNQNGVVIDSRLSSARSAIHLTDNTIFCQSGTAWMMKHIGTQDAILYSVSSKKNIINLN